jgi:hypothetical protein
MKRVGLCVPKPRTVSTTFVTPKPEEVEPVETPADAGRYPRARSLTYEKTKEEAVFKGTALSEAHVNHELMMALSKSR